MQVLSLKRQLVARLQRLWLHSRSRGILVTAGSTMISRGVGILASFLQVPIALHYLKTEAFGLWVTLINIATVLVLFDFGVSNAVQNEVAAAYGRQDWREACRAYVHGLQLLFLSMFVLIGCLFPMVYYLPWRDWFRLQNPELTTVLPSCVMLVGMSFAVGTPLAAVMRFLLGLQKGWIWQAVSAAGSVVTLIAVALAAWLHASYLVFLAMAIWPAIGLNAGLTAWSVYYYGRQHLQPRDWLPEKQSLWHLTKVGGLFLIPQLGATVQGIAAPLMISSILGPIALTPYSLVQRLLNVFYQLQMFFMPSVTAAYTEARERGDWTWIQKTYRTTLLFTFVFLTLPCLFANLWIPTALQLWTGKASALVSFNLVFFLGVSVGTWMFSQTALMLLQGLGFLKGQAIYATSMAVLGVILMPWLISWYGAQGAVLANLVGFLVVTMPCAFGEVILRLRRRQSPPKKAALEKQVAEFAHEIPADEPHSY